MTITLAATWNPRGELQRLLRLFPQLSQVYEFLVLCLPPVADPDQVRAIQADLQEKHPQVMIVLSSDWPAGRFLALQKAYETPASHVQYADLDRLLRWVETKPEEWHQAVDTIQGCDCLIFGRTEAAYLTHPQALTQTEALSNKVTSYLIDKPVDVSAGSKGFSRRAVEFILANTRPERALGTDAEWPVLLQRGGFTIEFMAVDGLDWESADHYQERAADAASQQRAAEAYDADPVHWARRVEVAQEIIQTGLEASRKVIKPVTLKKPLFDLDQVFEVDDYMFFYEDMLTDERTEAEVRALVQYLDLQSPMRILDLACGYGRIANHLARLGHRVTGVDWMPGFLDIARLNATAQGLEVDYRQGDMRILPFTAEFDRVLIMFTSFGYFEDDENLLVLKNVTAALKPGGLFLCDVPNRDIFIREMVPSIVTEKENHFMIDRGSFDTLTGRWLNQRVIIRNGVRKDKPFFIRLYNPNEVKSLFSLAGLHIDKMYDGWDGRTISTESRRMVIIARK